MAVNYTTIIINDECPFFFYRLLNQSKNGITFSSIYLFIFGKCMYYYYIDTILYEYYLVDMNKYLYIKIISSSIVLLLLVLYDYYQILSISFSVFNFFFFLFFFIYIFNSVFLF